MPDILPAEEAELLAQCEDIITEGIRNFAVMGRALAEIQGKKLYRATHKSFDDYCAARFQFTRGHAKRLIGAAAVMKELSETVPVGTVLPKNEATTRALAAVEPAKRGTVWLEATETSPQGPTAADVQRVAACIAPQPVHVPFPEEWADRLETVMERTKRHHPVPKAKAALVAAQGNEREAVEALGFTWVEDVLPVTDSAPPGIVVSSAQLEAEGAGFDASQVPEAFLEGRVERSGILAVASAAPLALPPIFGDLDGLIALGRGVANAWRLAADDRMWSGRGLDGAEPVFAWMGKLLDAIEESTR